jgi:hypothetical protein
MFRAQSNIFDDVVVKATDENLTSENWEYILVRLALTLLGSLVASYLDTWHVPTSRHIETQPMQT